MSWHSWRSQSRARDRAARRVRAMTATLSLGSIAAAGVLAGETATTRASDSHNATMRPRKHSQRKAHRHVTHAAHPSAPASAPASARSSPAATTTGGS
jgi:hypothetical protein